MRTIRILAAFACLLARAPGADAAPLAVGNLLVVRENVLYEFTTAGVLVQEFPIPSPSPKTPRMRAT